MDFVQKRDRLYRGTMIATVLFTTVACGLLVCFKRFEDYFDSHGRIAVVAEAALVEQRNATISSIRKRNFPVTVVDEPGAKLEIPFLVQTQKSNITVCEEFTQNKLVITLKDGSSYMEEGAVLTSDSAWMEAVGVYRHDDDIVIEVYCHDICAYQTVYENGVLSLSFLPIREQYENLIVVYTPWSNRNNIHMNEWNQTIQKLQDNHKVKIFSTIAMQEEYTAESVIEFANRVHADMVIGMELVDSERAEVITVCNPEYFIPEFGNIELAALQENEYAQKTGLMVSGVKACEETHHWIKQSRVPTALTQFYFSLNQKNVEQTYTLNRKMMEALGSIVKRIADAYWLPE